MELTVKDLLPLAERAGVLMWYDHDLRWVIDLPCGEIIYFTGSTQDNPKRNTARYILLGIIAEREGLVGGKAGEIEYHIGCGGLETGGGG